MPENRADLWPTCLGRFSMVGAGAGAPEVGGRLADERAAAVATARSTIEPLQGTLAARSVPNLATVGLSRDRAA